MNEVDVFISANSCDFQFAGEVYDFLDQHGLSVFFSERSLPKLGISDYRKEIDKALDHTKHMVVVASSRGNVESRWVEAEWGIFVNEMRSGRKNGNLITVVTEGLSIDKLPPSLRYYEVISLNKDGLKKLVSYLTIDKDKNDNLDILKSSPQEEISGKEAGDQNRTLIQTPTKPERINKGAAKGQGTYSSTILIAILVFILTGSVYYFRTGQSEQSNGTIKLSNSDQGATKDSLSSAQLNAPPPIDDSKIEKGTLAHSSQNLLIKEKEQVQYEDDIAEKVRIDDEKAAEIKQQRLAAKKQEEEKQRKAASAEKLRIEKVKAAKIDQQRLAAKEQEEEKQRKAANAEKLRIEKEKANKKRSYTDSVTGMEFVYIPAGCFNINRNGKEHCVDAVYIGKYEVTQKQYVKITNQNPSRFDNNDQHPVENVSWNDVQIFIDKLNDLSGNKYRLPTETEWEYAATGGVLGLKQREYAGSDSSNEVAWHVGNAKGTTHPVGMKLPNEFGLYDMSGNIWEWCSDSHTENFFASTKIIRGGSWTSRDQANRSVHHESFRASKGKSNIGFRLVISAAAISTSLENPVHRLSTQEQKKEKDEKRTTVNDEKSEESNKDQLHNLKRVVLRDKKLKNVSAKDLQATINRYKFYEKNINPLREFKNDFIVLNAFVIYDRATGLDWQRSGSAKKMSWRNTKKYIDKLNEKKSNGCSDWRLPTIDELASLLRKKVSENMYIHQSFF